MPSGISLYSVRLTYEQDCDVGNDPTVGDVNPLFPLRLWIGSKHRLRFDNDYLRTEQDTADAERRDCESGAPVVEENRHRRIIHKDTMFDDLPHLSDDDWWTIVAQRADEYTTDEANAIAEALTKSDSERWDITRRRIAVIRIVKEDGSPDPVFAARRHLHLQNQFVAEMGKGDSMVTTALGSLSKQVANEPSLRWVAASLPQADLSPENAARLHGIICGAAQEDVETVLRWVRLPWTDALSQLETIGAIEIAHELTDLLVQHGAATYDHGTFIALAPNEADKARQIHSDLLKLDSALTATEPVSAAVPTLIRGLLSIAGHRIAGPWVLGRVQASFDALLPLLSAGDLEALVGDLESLKSALADQMASASITIVSDLTVRLLAELCSTDISHQKNYADAVTSHAVLLSEVGDRSGAIRVSTETLGLWRVLDDAGTAHQLNYARAVDSHAVLLSEVGDRSGAIRVSTETLRLWRVLADTNTAHKPSYASALINHATWLCAVGDWFSALGKSEEAVGLWQGLAESNNIHEPSYASAVLNHADLLSEVAERFGEKDVAEEAVRSWQGLAEASTAHQPNFARAVTSYAALLSEVGEWSTAREESEKAVGLWLSLAADPAHELSYARAVTSYAALLSEVGEWSTAREESEKAVGLWRRLALTNTAHQHSYARAVNHFAVAQSSMRPEFAVRKRLEGLALVADLRAQGTLDSWSWWVGRVEAAAVRHTPSPQNGFLLDIVLSLERSRAIGLGETVRLRSRELEAVKNTHPNLARKYLQQLSMLDLADYGGAHDTAMAERISLDETIREIRSAGYPSFGGFPKPKELLATIRPGAVSVHLVVDPAKDRNAVRESMLGFALVTTSAGPIGAVVLDLTHAEAMALDRLVRTWTRQTIEVGSVFGAFQHASSVATATSARVVSESDHDMTTRISDDVGSLARRLGALLEPVLALVPADIDELILVPCGPTAALPWHAALLNDGDWLAERWSVRYAPTLTSLLQTSNGLATGAALIYTFGDELSATKAEAEVVQRLYGPVTLRDGASSDDYLDATRTAALNHTIAHGTPDFIKLNPHQIHRGRIGELSNLRRGPAVLSACSTLIGSAENPDERHSFVSSLLGIGHDCVLACPWPVADRAAALLAIGFHHQRRLQPGWSNSRQLAEVQRFLRAASTTDLAVWLRTVKADLHSDVTLDCSVDMPELTALAEAWEQEAYEPMPLAHPFYWAGLSVSGR
jgi:tetratricopeptide (TPR) repeat protein